MTLLSILEKCTVKLRYEVARARGGRCPSHPSYKNSVFGVHTTWYMSKFYLQIC